MQYKYMILPTDKDLQQHGVLGMKWGVRRYQPYSVVPRGSGEGGKEIGQARAYKKIAKGNIKLAYKQIRENAKEYMKVDKKTNKLSKRNSQKADTYAEKHAEKQAERKKILDEAMIQIDAADLAVGKEMVTKMLNNNQIKNLTLGSIGATAAYNAGLAGLRLAGIPTSWAPPVMIVPDFKSKAAAEYINKNRGKTPINYTTVIKAVDSKSSNSKSISSGSNSSSSKQSALDRAKNNDSWDLNFLESIQNSKILDDGNTSAMLKEYKQYLDDPEDYLKNRARRLQQV